MHATKQARQGFTLIELLMVIAIIAILAALVTVAVSKIMGVGPMVQTTSEIRQLALGVENFKSKYGVYPPSTFTLPPDADTFSTGYARAIWPRIVFSQCAGEWGGTGTLTANQCLVYFLRGPIGEGWSTNPSRPTKAKASPTEPRGGPFFEFPEARLWLYPASWKATRIYNATAEVQFGGASYRSLVNSNVNKQPDTSPAEWIAFAPVVSSFKDPFSTPGDWQFYVYFSSYRTPNGYQDSNAGLGVWPFYIIPAGSTQKRYYNPNSFQIISAGDNFLFGGGGAWTAGVGVDYSGEAANGFDDLSNFHPGKLGVP